jgi:hypothetical protein
MPAIASWGTTLKYGSAGTGCTYTGTPATLVGNVLSLNVDGISLTTIDVTTLSDRFRKFVGGLVDSGTLSLEVNLDTDTGSNQTTLYDDLDSTLTGANTCRAFLLEFGEATNNKGTTVQCAGYVTQFSARAGVDASVTASITIKLNGSVAIADVA